MTCIDSILDICKDDRALNEFKVEIRLVKIIFLCARKLCHPLKTRLLGSSVYRNGQQFCSLLLELKDGLPHSNLAGAAFDFPETLKKFRENTNKLYVEMLDALSVSQSRVIWDTRNFEPSWRRD